MLIVHSQVDSHSAESPSQSNIASPASHVQIDPGPVDRASKNKQSERSGTLHSEAPVAIDGQTKIAILASLQHWATDMASNDVGLMSSHYAERMDRYFLERNIDRPAVEVSMQKWLDSGDRMDALELRDISFDALTEGVVRVRLTKEISAVVASTPKALSVSSELQLAKHDDQWQIISERDFK